MKRNILIFLFLFAGLHLSAQSGGILVIGGSTPQGNTDHQQLSLVGNTLSIDNGAATIDLSGYLDNTDGQTITDFSLAGNILSITLSGGNTDTVDLSTIAGGGTGTVDTSGTPSVGQAAEFTDANTVQGIGITGSGLYVKQTSPSLTTPNLGTPSAAVLTNGTGYMFTNLIGVPLGLSDGENNIGNTNMTLSTNRSLTLNGFELSLIGAGSSNIMALKPTGVEFNTGLPTSVIIPTSDTQFSNKKYVDTGNKAPLTSALFGDATLSSLDQYVASGTERGRKYIYDVGNDSLQVTLNDTGAVDDVWPFRTSHANSNIEFIPDTGVTISFRGQTTQNAAEIRGFDQYAIVRKTAANNFTISGDVLIPLSTQVIQTAEPLATGDDGTEDSAGTVAIASGSLQYHAISSAAGYVAIRFPGSQFTIPDGKTISNAYVTNQSVTDNSTGTAITIDIKAELADGAALTTTANDISSRTQSTATVVWSPGDWLTGELYDTPNLAPIIQEWADRAGDAEGDDLVLIFHGNATIGARFAYSFDGAGSVPQLTLIYQ